MRLSPTDFARRDSSAHQLIVSSSFSFSHILKSYPQELLFSPIIAELQAICPTLHVKEELLIQISLPLQLENHYNES